jgi:ATP-dependent protease HslVU (ClpYQ) peptidase subunit
MSVVALTKFKDGSYHIFSDGRISSDDRIINDKCRKVFKTESVYRTPIIYGWVGSCADRLPLHNIIQAYGHDKNALYSALNDEAVRLKFLNFASIIVNEHDILMVDAFHKKNEFDDREVKLVAVDQYSDAELPIFIGSGEETLQAVFAARKPKNSEQVRKCYQIAYGLISSIGGQIFEEVL